MGFFSFDKNLIQFLSLLSADRDAYSDADLLSDEQKRRNKNRGPCGLSCDKSLAAPYLYCGRKLCISVRNIRYLSLYGRTSSDFYNCIYSI